MEQRARAVGRDYSVIPVHVSGGIFHPKLVYLEAEEGMDDALLIGSGNLTYPGHGGNVEVLEYLRPSLHANAFIEASAFFSDLNKSPRLQIPDNTALQRVVKRSRLVASHGKSLEPVSFVHCLKSTGLKQFSDAARTSEKPWQELLVLSPYHHPDAEPVRQLINDLSIKRLLVGVSSKQTQKTAFPYEKARGFVKHIQSVSPITDRGTYRNLHAKWFELRRPGAAITLTGSFNATQTSLNSTQNVECGVIRHLPRSTASVWLAADEPAYEKNDFPKRGDASISSIFCSLDSSLGISGLVLGKNIREGIWKAKLEGVDRIHEVGPVVVDETGAFAWKITCRIDDMSAGTLQLTLVREGVTARGWVQLSRFLALSASKRLLFQSISSLGSGNHSTYDIQNILDFISGEAANLFLASNPPQTDSAQSSLDTAVQKPTDTAITAQQFAALRDANSPILPYDSNALLGAMNNGGKGWALLEHILAALTQWPKGVSTDSRQHSAENTILTSAAGQIGAETGEDEEGGEEEIGANEQHTDIVIGKQLNLITALFEDQILKSDASFQAARSDAARHALSTGKIRLLFIWSLIELRFRLLRPQEEDLAHPFLWNWLKRVCNTEAPVADKGFAHEQVCGVSAAVSLWLLEGYRKSCVVDEISQVHRVLESYFSGEIDQPTVLQNARIWLQSDAGAALVGGRTDQAIEALSEVISQPTTRQILVRILNDGVEKHKDEAVRVFGEINTRQLRQALVARDNGRAGYIAVEPKRLHGCPKCNHSYLTHRLPNGTKELDREISWKLKAHNMVKCPYCPVLLITLKG